MLPAMLYFWLSNKLDETMPSVTRPFKTRDPFLKTPKKSSGPGYIFLKNDGSFVCKGTQFVSS